jgi:exonuclease SbcC
VLDSEKPVDELGQTLAGTPGELDAAIADVVGLPYDQFVKCVLLPQGDFAAFLHAKPAERQEILVKLLGLGIYEQIRERASEREKAAVSQLAATERILAELTAEAAPEHLEAAQARLDAVTDLAQRMVAKAPELSALDARREAAVAALARIEGQLAAVESIRPGGDIAALATAAQQARTKLAASTENLTAATEEEEKARGRLAATADPTAVQRLLDARGQLGGLTDRQREGDLALAKAKQAHEKAQAAMAKAAIAAGKAAEHVSALQQALEDARNIDRVAVLRPLLRKGHQCMVCEQAVATLPPPREVGATKAAQDVLQRAKAAAEKSEADRSAADQAARETDRRLASVTAKVDELGQQIAHLELVVADAPAEAELKAQLAAHLEARSALEETARARKRSVDQHQAALAEVQRVDERLKSAWRLFDTARDKASAAVVAGDPLPAVDRDDLEAAWRELQAWTASAVRRLTVARADAERSALDATKTEQALLNEVAEWFAAAGVPMPKEIGSLDRSVTVAVERASAAKEKVLDAQRRAADLLAQRKQIEDGRAVAAALAQHLKANNFEAWLLEEALDALVLGASGILLELSAGQYDLIHRSREFYVVDHHDAGLTRPVRTLSGGETFQASLALALALADQLAGMAHSAGLESILLDEGFGTLDASTLDIVAATLENLAAKGDRMVGVVTHVPALAERIPVRFEVRKDARTARVDRIG